MNKLLVKDFFNTHLFDKLTLLFDKVCQPFGCALKYIQHLDLLMKVCFFSKSSVAIFAALKKYFLQFLTNDKLAPSITA